MLNETKKLDNACQRLTVPKFTKAVIEKCKKCKYASARIRWCGFRLFGGVWIGDQKQRPSPNYPSIIKMAGSLTSDYKVWLAAGKPLRTPEQITAILEICKQCQAFVPQKKRCKVCGCYLNKKVRWATTKCKLGKW